MIPNSTRYYPFGVLGPYTVLFGALAKNQFSWPSERIEPSPRAPIDRASFVQCIRILLAYFTNNKKVYNTTKSAAPQC